MDALKEKQSWGKFTFLGLARNVAWTKNDYNAVGVYSITIKVISSSLIFY